MTYIPEFDRKDSIQRPRTLSLFLETNQSSLGAVFTLKDQDHELNGNKYYSLRKIYMEIADVTEYEVAMAVFGSWNHWKKIIASPPLIPYIQQWREELEIKNASRIIKGMIETAETEGSKGLTAAKYVLEKGWEKKAGRPSKKEIERTRRVHAGIKEEIEDDARNIGLLN